jgi:hypothetical protein
MVIGCSTTKSKPPANIFLQTNDEFEKQIEIKEVAMSQPVVAAQTHAPLVEDKKKKMKVKKSKSVLVEKPLLPESAAAVVPKVRLPIYEDSAGFAQGSRRPIIDPFHINEKVVLDCSYMGATVGSLTLEVMPFVEVNNRKSYRWIGRLHTNDFFSKIFLVNDSMEVLSDFESLVPSAYRLHVKEEKQLKESRALYKSETNEATYWEKKWTEKDGDTDKKQKWIMEPFAQNYFSTLFYIRVFKYEVGKEYLFMLSENEKNTRFKNLVVRKEVLKNELGSFKTIVLKPQVEADGAYKPVGDSYIWVTDDDRRMIVKIEAALKFGTLVFDLKSIDLGLP